MSDVTYTCEDSKKSGKDSNVYKVLQYSKRLGTADERIEFLATFFQAMYEVSEQDTIKAMISAICNMESLPVAMGDSKEAGPVVFIMAQGDFAGEIQVAVSEIMNSEE